MRIAVMGAGLSGLSCAITLERFGVYPDIFEKRSCPGDRFVNAEAMFGVLNRPVRDTLAFLKETYGIRLKPIDTVNKLILHSANETGCLVGELGCTNIRGRHPDSFESQLAAQVKSEIHYNTDCNYEELCKTYDAVLLATGDGAYAAHLGNYKCDLTCTIKGATVTGDFATGMPHVWFHYGIVPKGYIWLIPFNQKEANLVLAYPDYPDNIKLDIEAMWAAVFARACRDLDQDFQITDRFEITRYMMGICGRPKIDNTYYAGNCFGAISPGLGFGQFTAILTGVYAAMDMLGVGSYEALAKPLFENYNHSLVLRRYLEGLDDAALDRRIKKAEGKTLGWLFSSGCGIDLLKWATPVLRFKTKKLIK